MNKYYTYFKYILEHKYNVFKECMNMSKDYKGKAKRDLIVHAFTHDLSKFGFKEFFAYANYDFQNNKNTDKVKTNFKKAWKHHYTHNKHHWNCWSYGVKDPLRMPVKYIRYMICDISAMSRKFGDTPQEFYLKNYNNIKLNRDSRHLVEILLKIDYRGLDTFMNYATIEEIIKESLQYQKLNPNSFDYKWFYDEYLGGFKEKYKVDMLEILNLKDDRGENYS